MSYRPRAAGLLAIGLCLWLAGCNQGQGPAAPETPAVLAPGATPSPGATLRAVRDRGRVNCGVHQGPGFAYQDARQVWQGFNVDYCRALAAAVFGDAERVNIVPQTSKGFSLLLTGQVDVMAGGAWTFTRDAGLNLDFPAVTYYDGQGFLVPSRLNLKRPAELSRARVCVVAATNAEANLVEYFRSQNINIRRVVLETEDLARQTYESGGCDALTDDRSNLASQRVLLKAPAEHAILPGTISKEPLGPVVRQGDAQWADIVRWTANVMVLGEELKLDSETVDQARRRPANDEVRRLLGGEVYGRMLGLRDDWAFQILRQVGSYGEVFDRNIGPRTPLALDRGLNALWSAPRPGLIYAPPMR